MVGVDIVTETSQEANWNGQADGQDHLLRQADALTKNLFSFFEFFGGS